MTPILGEVQAMQNPALGAALLWRFACGYCPERTATGGVPLPLLFTVLPITLHARTCEEVSRTFAASGLRKFEEKFREHIDLLLAIHQRAVTMRSLSLRSLRIALAAGLLTILTDSATVWPRTYTRIRDVPSSVTELIKAAERLGTWCASLSLFEVSGILRVEF